MPAEVLAEDNNAENNNNQTNSTPTSRPIIGIIYPPPEVRNIVDKTASFVARNGPEFEARIRQNELNNPKFNFLNGGDPYHAYYQHKVKECKEGKIEITPIPGVKELAIQQKKQEVQRIIETPIIPKEPPPDFEFISDPPSISAFDLDVVKLTAQFVARNGRQFLTNLMNREQRNYQFDFLRPQHSLFNYFTKLLEQYTKVLIPPKDLLAKLKKESSNPKSILDQVKYRVEWSKLQEAQKRREEEEAERERVAYAQIDWHDFIIVETVDYQPHEQGQFPPPTTPEEVGVRVLAQQRYGDTGVEVAMDVDSDQELDDADVRGVSDNIQVQDMEEDSDEEMDRRRVMKAPLIPIAPPLASRVPSPPPPPPPAETIPQPPPLPPNPDQVVIRKDYDPKNIKQLRSATSDEFLISPITGEKIPVNKVQEHMRIGLLDPRWVEQRDRSMQDKMTQEEVYAQGSAIESSLKQLAERRTDIFGIGDEETAIGKKIGEEDKKKEEKVTWDGHTASMEAATRAARANITLEEQIHQIHKVKGLLPDEEKERIGPSKPQSALSKSVTIMSSPTISAKPVPAAPPAPSAPTPMQMGAPGMVPPMPPMAALHQPLMAPPPGMMLVPRPPMGPPPMRLVPPHPPVPPPLPPAVSQPPHHSAYHTPAPPPPPIPPRPPPPDDEPSAKKQKTEDSLIPEDEFLQKNASPVLFKVQVPNISDKAEWKLNGQLVSLTLPLTDSVSVIKAKIHEQVGMPPGKQKLQLEGMFFKDSNSLAFYNILPNSIIQLQLKERGGRKK